MKLCRIGPPGREEPALFDSFGKIRTLVGIVDDIDAKLLEDDGLSKLSRTDVVRLPVVPGRVRYGPCIDKSGSLRDLLRILRLHVVEEKPLKLALSKFGQFEFDPVFDNRFGMREIGVKTNE